jgi:hypothetical protein
MSGKELDHGRRSDVASFAEALRQLPKAAGGRGRLIFALDATASRQPTWDMAMAVQGQMFVEAERLGGLDVQLVFYRGFGECKASRWVVRPRELLGLMTSVTCRAGQTQIGRVLRHALKEASKARIHALVFIGDALEEGVDELGELAGQLGLRGVRTFVFQEGTDPAVEYGFREIARLSGGAWCRFDRSAPQELRALLGAVAAYAAGGLPALESAAKRAGTPAQRLLAQLR